MFSFENICFLLKIYLFSFEDTCNRIQNCLLQKRLTGQILFLRCGADDADADDDDDDEDADADADDDDEDDDADDEDGGGGGDNEPRLSFAGHGTRDKYCRYTKVAKVVRSAWQKSGENKNTQHLK